MSAGRQMRRKAARAGLCPNCRERQVEHVVPIMDGMAAVACGECWPVLRHELVSAGLHVSGCVGPCCNAGS